MFWNLLRTLLVAWFLCLWDQDIARLAFGVTLISDSVQYGRVGIHLRSFFVLCLLGQEERGVHTAARNFANTISWCSLAAQQVYTV